MYAITYMGNLKNRTCEYNKKKHRKQASVYQRGKGKGRGEGQDRGRRLRGTKPRCIKCYKDIYREYSQYFVIINRT